MNATKNFNPQGWNYFPRWTNKTWFSTELFPSCCILAPSHPPQCSACRQPTVLQHCSWGEAKCYSDVPKTAPGTLSLQGQPERHFKLQLYQQALKIKCSAEPGTKPLHLHNSNTCWFLSIKNYVIFCLISPARRTSLALTFLSTRAGSLRFCFFPPSQDAVIQLQENHSESLAWGVSSSPFPKLY